MWQAGIAGVSSKDILFSPFRSGNPGGSLLLAVGTRIVFGLIAGLVFSLIFHFLKKGRLAVSLVFALVLKHVHALLVYRCMAVIFHPDGVCTSKVFRNMFKPVQLEESAYIAAIFLVLYAVFDHWLSRKYHDEYTECRSLGKEHILTYVLLGVIFAVLGLLMLIHMSVRVDTLFDVADIAVEKADTSKILQVMMQFMCGFCALTYLLINIVNHYRAYDESRYYMAEKEKEQISSQLNAERDFGKSLAYEAEHDALTGMLNRSAFNKVIESESLKDKPIGFMLADIDHFKEVNDTFGHEVGDKMLARTAGILKEVFRADDLIYRIGGDEFAVILPYYKKEDSYLITEKVAEINRKLQQPDNGMPAITVSAGYDFSTDGYHEDLFVNADAALYCVKRSSRGGCRIFSEEEDMP